EFLQEHPDLDLLLAPVGGGGLLAGTGVVAKDSNPRICVVGCEPEAVDDAKRSVQAGHIVPQTGGRPGADGLRTSPGKLPYPLILRHVDEIVTVSEESIVEAMRLAWEVLKIIIEPSSSVPLAAVLTGRLPVEGRSVGIILSGGNVDLDRLPWR